MWESIQPQRARLMEQGWPAPLFLEADILGKGSPTLCFVPLCMLVCGIRLIYLLSRLCCPPKSPAVWKWRRPRDAGRLGNGMSRAGRVEFGPKCHQLGYIQDLYTLLRALSLWVGFWTFFGRLFPEANKLRRNQRPGLHPSTRTFSYEPMRRVSASLA